MPSNGHHSCLDKSLRRIICMSHFSIYTLHGKPCFLFPDVLKRWSFQKNSAGTWSLLYYRKRWYFFFPKTWTCSIDGKRKMIFLEKYSWKCDIFFKCSEKMVFSKMLHWDMIFLVLSGKIVFFFAKTWYFFLGRKLKDDLSQETHGTMIFFLYTCRCYKHDIMSLC